MDAPENKTPAPPTNGRHDVLTHRIVVGSLGLTVICTAVEITILQLTGKDVPSSLANLGAVAIGALAMCLASIMRQP